MKVDTTKNTVVVVELSRRNLETLLAKLDDPSSMRSIYKQSEDGLGGMFVNAVPDSEHYKNREPGEILVNGVQ